MKMKNTMHFSPQRNSKFVAKDCMTTAIPAVANDKINRMGDTALLKSE
jgi:hypothetical protein